MEDHGTDLPRWIVTMNNLVQGMILGLVMGCLIVVIWGLPALFGDRAPDAWPFWLIALVYPLAGSAGGAIAGAFGAWARTWLRAGVVGVLALLPLVATIGAIESGVNEEGLRGTLAVAAVLGFPFGVIGRKLILEIDPFGPSD